MKITKKLRSTALAFFALSLLAQVNAVESQDVQTQKNPEKIYSTSLKEHMIKLAKTELNKGFLTPEVEKNTRQELDQFKKDPNVGLEEVHKMIVLKQQAAIIEKIEEGMSDAVYDNDRYPGKGNRRTYKLHQMYTDGKVYDNKQWTGKYHIGVRVKNSNGLVYDTIVPQDIANEIFEVFVITEHMKSQSIDEFELFLERIKLIDIIRQKIEKFLPEPLHIIRDKCNEKFRQESLDFTKNRQIKQNESVPNDGY